MDYTLDGMLYDSVFQYIDDTLVSSNTFDSHLQHLAEVRDRFLRNNLRIKLRKCHFFADSIDYLGRAYNREGMHPLGSNVEAIENFATPTDVAAVRSYLGTVGYYRDFVPSFASLATPLTRLLKKGVDFGSSWGPDQDKAFREIKRVLISSPFLHTPDYTLPFIVSADTSEIATGAVLSQDFPVEKHPNFQEKSLVLEPVEEKLANKGWYKSDSVFSPRFQLPLQIGKDLFHSVDHYLLYRKARLYGSPAVVTRILELQPTVSHKCPQFGVALSELTTVLEGEVASNPDFVGEAWDMYEGADMFLATMWKFWLHQDATKLLLSTPPLLRPERGHLGKYTHPRAARETKVLYAVKSRLKALQLTDNLPNDRAVYCRYPVSFYSCTLTDAESKYDAREKELLGLVRGCEKFDSIISGSRGLYLETDHLNLYYLYNIDHSGRLFRWANRLQRYAPFVILPAPGFAHLAPDGLSRYYSSIYQKRNLKDVLYGVPSQHRPPHVEVLEVLNSFLPPNVVRLYEPIQAYSQLPRLWQKFARVVVQQRPGSNYFDKEQQLPTGEYDAIVSHGPHSGLATMLPLLEAQPKPWALLVPTLTLTRPQCGFQKIAGLQVLPCNTMLRFTGKHNRRGTPLHLIWVTHRFDFPAALQFAPMEDIWEASVSAPDAIEIAEQYDPLAEFHPGLKVLPTEAEPTPPIQINVVKKKNYSKKAPERFEVEAVVNHRDNSVGQREFLIQWKGYPGQDTWEPETGLDCPHALAAYWSKIMGTPPVPDPPSLPQIDPPPAHRSHGLTDPKWEHLDAELQVWVERLRELSDAPGRRVEISRVNDKLQEIQNLMAALEAEAIEEESGVPHPIQPSLTTEVPMEMPRLGTFRALQIQDPKLRAYLLAACHIEEAKTDELAPSLSQVVCFSRKTALLDDSVGSANKILLLRRITDINPLSQKFPTLNQLPSDRFGFPKASSVEEAARLLTYLMASAHNQLSQPVLPSRFKRSVVRVGPTKESYFQIQLTGPETAALSVTDFCWPRWLRPREVQGETLTLEAEMFVSGLRDNGVRPQLQQFPPNLIVRDGILYYVHPTTNVACVVVPPALQLKLMYIAHDIPFSRHRSAARVYALLQKSYWWKNMRQDIYHYCSGCIKCHRAKATQRYRLGVLLHYDLCPVGHTRHVDFFGPLTPTKEGYTIAMTVCDAASGYPWLYPCVDSTVETLAREYYVRHILENGFHPDMVTDNGPSFRSAFTAALDRRAGVRHLFTTSYNPRSNGKVERPHRTIKAGLRCLGSAATRNWNEDAQAILSGLRIEAVEGGGPYSPFSLWFNRDPIAPTDLLSGRYDLAHSPQPNRMLDALDYQRRGAEILSKLARDRHEKEARQQVDVPPAPVWEPGQLVLIHRNVVQKDLSQKLLCQWAGPFRVVQRVSPTVYRVDLGNGRASNYAVHRLSPFAPSTHPRTVSTPFVDLFDIDSVLGEGPEVEAIDLPLSTIPDGFMVLAVVDDDLRLGQVKSTDHLTGRIRIHLYDTTDLAANRGSPERWQGRQYPTYLTSVGGLVARKPEDTVDEFPLEEQVTSADILDVPFQLSSTRTLNLAQRTVIRQWYGGEASQDELAALFPKL
jgi:predicted NAD-dependent protein-ADP-ribosyltransferase YbiA (DUF1768 family)